MMNAMRWLVLGVFAFLTACTPGPQLYDDCAPESVGALQCVMGCPGGGVGCDTPVLMAARCENRGPPMWLLAFSCGQCAEADGGAVACEEDGPPLAEFGDSCDGEVLSCSVDRHALMRCSEGRFILAEKCEGTCGVGPDGLACL